MPQDAGVTSSTALSTNRSSSKATASSPEWFTTPQLIRRLFDEFPLRTYPVNELPRRSPQNRDRHALWIFTTCRGARVGAPSFNPGCLKWQAYLVFQGVDFVTISSNNHASPTGALPFLLPASNFEHTREAVLPIPSTRIERWVREKDANQHRTVGTSSGVCGGTSQQAEASLDIRYEAYMSLLNYRIRNAYLFSLYLTPSNFASIVVPLYIQPNTSSTLARFALSRQLRTAAESELLKQSRMIDVEALHRDCDKAFEALSELLGDDEFFFGKERPGLFDASVFAYTHIFLDESLDWKETKLEEILKQYGNLVEHQSRIIEGWFGKDT